MSESGIHDHTLSFYTDFIVCACVCNVCVQETLTSIGILEQFIELYDKSFRELNHTSGLKINFSYTIAAVMTMDFPC